MSSFGLRLVAAGLATGLVAGSAAAQLLPPLPIPSLGLPVGQVPVAGPALEQIVGRREMQQVISPTLDSVSGLPTQVINAGQATLLDLRRLRLQQLVRENRNALEAVENGVPVRRGLLVAIDPDPTSLQLAARAGFRVIGQENDA